MTDDTLHVCQVVALSAYACVVLMVLVRHLLLDDAVRRTPFLLPAPPTTTKSDPVHVTILVPAKDEAASIRECLESLLAQDHEAFDVIVIDDRSSDATAAIVDALALREPRLRCLRITQLPAGWTGKTHALHVGQQSARGEWLLFVDADTRLDPSCVRTVIGDALAHRADLESMLLALDCRSFWERVIQPFAGICLMVLYPLTKVNDPNKKDMGFANGQFILVRRSAYDRIGGHASVRERFVEDIHLGRLARKRGLALRVVMAPDLAKVRMYASLAGIIRGWSRILYSAVDCQPARLYALFVSILVFSVLAYGAFLWSGTRIAAGWATSFTWWVFWLSACHNVLQTTLMARIYALSRSNPSYVLLRPLAVFVMLYILAKTIRMCRTHRVEWRGTRYEGLELGSGSSSASSPGEAPVRPRDGAD